MVISVRRPCDCRGCGIDKDEPQLERKKMEQMAGRRRVVAKWTLVMLEMWHLELHIRGPLFAKILSATDGPFSHARDHL